MSAGLCLLNIIRLQLKTTAATADASAWAMQEDGNDAVLHDVSHQEMPFSNTTSMCRLLQAHMQDCMTTRMELRNCAVMQHQPKPGQSEQNNEEKFMTGKHRQCVSIFSPSSD